MYWTPRNCQQLGNDSSPWRRLRVACLGGGDWRSHEQRQPPVRLLASLRDANIDAMLAAGTGRECRAAVHGHGSEQCHCPCHNGD